MSAHRAKRGRSDLSGSTARNGIGLLVLSLVLIALCWPLISLTRLPFADVEQLSISELKRLRAGDPVELRGVVTFVDEQAGALYFQDELSGLRIEVGGELPEPGERITLRAEIDADYERHDDPHVVKLAGVRITKRKFEGLPPPQSVAIADLLRGSRMREARRVETSGIVRHAERSGERLVLELGDAGALMSVVVLHADGIDTASLIDRRVTVRGTLELGLDRIAETFAPRLWVVAPTDLIASADLPPQPLLVASGFELVGNAQWVSQGHRVRLRGTVVRLDSPGTLLLDAGGLLIPVESSAVVSFAPGESIEVLGWPTRTRWNIVLQRAALSRIGDSATEVAPVRRSKPLDSIPEIRALDSAAAALPLPVSIEATVTSVHYAFSFLFVQAGESAIFVDAWGQSLEALQPGMRVAIRGITAPGEFAPVIAQPWIEVLGPGKLPRAQVIDRELAPSGAYDSEWVELEGLVRPFTFNGNYTAFHLQTTLGSVSGALITRADPAQLESLVDARVRVRGVLGTAFTGKGILTGYRIFVHSVDDFEVLQAAVPSSSLTRQPIDQLLRFQATADGSRRALVQGTVTLQTADSLYLQDDSGSVQVQSPGVDVRVGDVVEAIGYASPSQQGPLLTDAIVRPLGRHAPIEPIAVTPEEVLSGDYDNRLVSIDARLVSQGQTATQQSLVLQAGQTVFNSELEGSIPLPTLREGSIVRVVGICAVRREHLADRFRSEYNAVPDSFRVLLRSADDVRVLNAAPWWSWRHIWPIILVLTSIACAAMAWARVLRKRVEAQRAQIEDQSSFLRQVIDMCPDLISVKDREGRYTLVNRALAEECGRTPKELIGKTERELLEDEARVRALELVEHEVLEGRAEITIPEYSMLDASGRVRWFQIVKRPLLDEAGNVTHVLGVSNEITAHKESERLLEDARAAADAANRAKSEFLANMSHEIRTPLNGIIGMSELCLDTDLSSEQRQYVQALKLSGDNLLGVINDILDFSKLEAGRLELEMRELDLRETFGAVIRTLALQAHGKGIELVCDIAPNVPLLVRGDANRLRQILLNLIGDAIRVTERGEVVVAVQLQAQDAQECVLRFVIADSSRPETYGEEALSAKLAQDVDAAGGRLGSADLGRTISAKLVALMNGRVWYERVEPQGRELHVTVQLGALERQPQVSVPPGVLLLRGAKILIVDDNAAQRGALVQMLARVGMRAVCAASASEAMERLMECAGAGDPCAVALVDYDMPVANGSSLVQCIRARRIPLAVVMMLSSMSHREGASSCRELDVEGQIVKPIFADELHATVARVLEHREMEGVRGQPLQAPAPSEPTREACPGKQGLNVLVAEDNTVNQMVMQRLLHKRGHRVTIAGSGRAALEAYESDSFDLIFMDVQMPELDGLEATREIRRRETGRERTPIVALTAHAMSGDRERCLAAGMDSYMTKPVNPTELDEMLARYEGGLRRAASGAGAASQ